jgi:hypothetical protein
MMEGTGTLENQLEATKVYTDDDDDDNDFCLDKFLLMLGSFIVWI